MVASMLHYVTCACTNADLPVTSIALLQILQMATASSSLRSFRILSSRCVVCARMTMLQWVVALRLSILSSVSGRSTGSICHIYCVELEQKCFALDMSYSHF